jgi:hypothetical protein
MLCSVLALYLYITYQWISHLLHLAIAPSLAFCPVPSLLYRKFETFYEAELLS